MLCGWEDRVVMASGVIRPPKNRVWLLQQCNEYRGKRSSLSRGTASLVFQAQRFTRGEIIAME